MWENITLTEARFIKTMYFFVRSNYIIKLHKKKDLCQWIIMYQMYVTDDYFTDFTTITIHYNICDVKNTLLKIFRNIMFYK